MKTCLLYALRKISAAAAPAILLCAASAGIRAQDAVPAPETGTASAARAAFSVLDDNDFFGKWSDKYYTNHTRLALTLDSDNLPDGLLRQWFFSLGQEIYTPKDRAATVPDPRDHPYAGYLYVSAGTAIFDDDFAVLQEIQLGATGDWSLAEQTQKEYHRLIDEIRPAGWDTQIHRRVVGQAIGEIRKRVMLSGACGNEDYGSDLILHGFGGLGNLRGVVSAGAELRAGWNLPKDFGVMNMRQSASAMLDPRVKASVYGYLDLSADAVLWDKTLTGNNDRGADIYAYPLAAQLTVGICVIYDRFMFSTFQSFRTKDFSSQDNDFFAYGGFKFSVFF